MKRVAVFGNAGGGKSTLARRLAELTGLPLFSIDRIQFEALDGTLPRQIPHAEYLQAHADLLRREEWIIDGFSDIPSAWERFAAADTLIHVDLPLLTHYRFVTKRLIQGLFCQSGRVAGGQSDLEQDGQQLSGYPPLPPSSDPQVSSARGQLREDQARPSVALAKGNPRVSRHGRERAHSRSCARFSTVNTWCSAHS